METFLIDYRGTLVVISHDRHFLNSVATHVADVDYQTITVYTGNYQEFVEAKYENRQRQEAQNKSAKKKIDVSSRSSIASARTPRSRSRRSRA